MAHGVSDNSRTGEVARHDPGGLESGLEAQSPSRSPRGAEDLVDECTVASRAA